MQLLPDKSEKEILLKLIKDVTSVDLDINQYSFTNPRTTLSSENIDLTDPNSNLIANTAITVYNKDNVNYVSEVSFNYRRIDIEDQWKLLFGSNDYYIDYREIPSDIDNRNRFLISKIKHILRINLEKIAMQVFSRTDTYEVLLKADKKSLVYTGETTVTIKKIDTRYNLSLMNDVLLDGFTYVTKSTPLAWLNKAHGA